MSSSGEVAGQVAVKKEKVRSQPPDVIVAVGSGETLQEFECYKVILSFASEYLDTMLSSNMKERAAGRIEFPDKNPEEWKAFFEFITPHQIGEVRHHAEIDSENVMTFLPWFHEFQMENHVKECDECIAQNHLSVNPESFWAKARSEDESEAEHQARLEKRKDKFDKILRMLNLTNAFDLKCAKEKAERMIADLMTNALQTDDLFDLASIESLLLVFLPLKLNEAGLSASGGESKHLWPVLEKILSPHISILSQEIINDQVNFPRLFYCFMQIKIEKDRVQEEREKTRIKAKNTINCMLKSYPDRLYGNMPTSFNGRVDELGRKKLKEAVYIHYKENKAAFQGLGISLPSDYYW